MLVVFSTESGWFLVDREGEPFENERAKSIPCGRPDSVVVVFHTEVEKQLQSGARIRLSFAQGDQRLGEPAHIRKKVARSSLGPYGIHC